MVLGSALMWESAGSMTEGACVPGELCAALGSRLHRDMVKIQRKDVRTPSVGRWTTKSRLARHRGDGQGRWRTSAHHPQQEGSRADGAGCSLHKPQLQRT